MATDAVKTHPTYCMPHQPGIKSNSSLDWAGETPSQTMSRMPNRNKTNRGDVSCFKTLAKLHEFECAKLGYFN